MGRPRGGALPLAERAGSAARGAGADLRRRDRRRPRAAAGPAPPPRPRRTGRRPRARPRRAASGPHSAGRPAGSRRRRAAALACFARRSGAARARPERRARAPGELVVSFLDVGQGDATLLQLDGAAVLVDTGPADGPILRRLSGRACSGSTRWCSPTPRPTTRAPRSRSCARTRRGCCSTAARAGRAPSSGRSPPRWPPPVRRVATVAGQDGGSAAIRIRSLAAAPPPACRRRRRTIAPWCARPGRRGSTCSCPPTPSRTSTRRSRSGPSTLSRSPITAATTTALPAPASRPAPTGRRDRGRPANTYGHPTGSTLARCGSVPRVYRTDRDGTVRLRVRGGRTTIERTGGA